jgi:multisubunit Na+/H+ antiporter MnhF subunit
VNVWLWMATGLVALLVPLLAVAVFQRAVHGLVALEVGGTLAVTASLLIAEGTNRQGFADLALVLAAASFVGVLAYLRFLERVR